MTVSTSKPRQGEPCILTPAITVSNPPAGDDTVNANIPSPFLVTGSDSAYPTATVPTGLVGTLTDMTNEESWNGTAKPNYNWGLNFTTGGDVERGDYLQVNVRDGAGNSDQVGYRETKTLPSPHEEAEQSTQGTHHHPHKHGAPAKATAACAITVTLKSPSSIDTTKTQDITVTVDIPACVPAGSQCFVFLAKLNKSQVKLKQHSKIEDQQMITASSDVTFKQVHFGSWEGVSVVATVFQDGCQPGTKQLKKVDGDF